MAQFRTTADIADEVLQKSGEPTNGNSPYETLVVTYLNKVQQAIIGGGSIFSLKVDESWTWARAKYPMVLELQPAYVTGTISTVNGDINIIFSEAPAISVQGWFIQVQNKRTLYKITQHTAGNTAAVIDSNFLDESGSHQFRCFKLDYDLVPQFIYVDHTNDKIDFIESGTTELTVTLTHGSYTPTTLIAHVVNRLNTIGTVGTYSGSYDGDTGKFSLTSTLAGGLIFSLLGATGTNRRRSGLPLLGYDLLDQTGSGTYTSSFKPNGISRLIEPFKVFTQANRDPQIESTDSINMEVDYPIAYTKEKIPDRFCKISEDNEGIITVRFNAYPAAKTKITIDWIPVPIDLQDNTASYPIIPRKDIDVLIHGTAMFILFDKEDSKWQQMLELCRAGLDAMEKKNRSELFRTGEYFGQIIPRMDYLNERKKLDYGYTSTSQPTSPAASVQTMIQSTISYSSFQAASTTKTVTARTLPANRSLFSIIVKHSTSFTGGTISAVTIAVGITGDLGKFITSFDVYQAVSPTALDSVITIYYPGAATDITVTATATGANLSELTQGSLDIYFSEQVVG